MQNILLDTSILIESQRNKNVQRILQQQEKYLVLSRIVAYELIQGSKTKAQKKQNLELLRHIPILELNETISKKAFHLMCAFIPRKSLSIPDALVATTAIEHHCTLWTKNMKDFSGITGLTLYQ